MQIPDGERDAFRIGADDLKALPAALRARYTAFDRAGGLHAAACFDTGGRIHRLSEDVGRHNALDKLIGSYLGAGEPPLANRGALLTGRAASHSRAGSDFPVGADCPVRSDFPIASDPPAAAECPATANSPRALRLRRSPECPRRLGLPVAWDSGAAVAFGRSEKT